jgi:hypothetical protein
MAAPDGFGGKVETVSANNLKSFLERLGDRFQRSAELYLLGGSALLLLGSPRETLDIDYLYIIEADLAPVFQKAVDELAAEMKLDLEWVPLQEFIPMPANAFERRRLLGQYGQVAVYIFDPYSIAISKIARGFESDLEDVLFLLQKGIIEFSALEGYFNSVLPEAAQSDIDPAEFAGYFDVLKRKWGIQRKP